ncbi:hypothetical protein AALP_AA3G095800 [Arabis alpina]|uniref:Uncharacterized protein n=1 Tax=Arabis alpina TaxID=50452 RepID=A0A087H845_ARAAL|nr:hypothetical protein AALP_AA3G095800 [Arabis alpina]
MLSFRFRKEEQSLWVVNDLGHGPLYSVRRGVTACKEKILYEVAISKRFLVNTSNGVST